MKVILMANTPDPERVIASAGKLCYSQVGIEEINEKMSDEQVEKFVNMLASIGHHSPLEHVSFTFGIEGVSRALTHQLVRHRLASYSQQSQRYVKEELFDYIIPKDIKNNDRLNLKYEQHMLNVQEMYDEFVEELIVNYMFDEKYDKYFKQQLKKCNIDECDFYDWAGMRFKRMSDLKEDYKKLYSILEKRAIENARYIFPNAIETKIVVTMNLRTLINFSRHRTCSRAQDEIRELSNQINKLISEKSPLLGRFLGAPCQFGKCPEGKMSCGKPLNKKIGGKQNE